MNVTELLRGAKREQIMVDDVLQRFRKGFCERIEIATSWSFSKDSAHGPMCFYDSEASVSNGCTRWLDLKTMIRTCAGYVDKHTQFWNVGPITDMLRQEIMEILDRRDAVGVLTLHPPPPSPQAYDLSAFQTCMPRLAMLYPQDAPRPMNPLRTNETTTPQHEFVEDYSFISLNQTILTLITQAFQTLHNCGWLRLHGAVTEHFLRDPSVQQERADNRATWYCSIHCARAYMRIMRADTCAPNLRLQILLLVQKKFLTGSERTRGTLPSG
jgi:hypothetical protein